jgi:DNA-binding LacI/PurR family transcriptional regulator
VATRKRTRVADKQDRVKLHDVAVLAGVSAQTVSRVVRNSPGVAEPTRLRVLDAVTTLGYRPNLAARSLSAGRIGAVHVVVAAKLYHGMSESFVAIVEALAGMGLATSTSIGYETTDLRSIVPVTADGVIVLGGMREREAWLEQVVARVPVVYVGRTSELPAGVSGIMVDQRAGARMAVERLAAIGRTRLAHIIGPEDWFDTGLRLQGFEEAASSLGLPYELHRAGSWEGIDAARVGSEVSRDVDGVFTSNDHLALGFMSHAHRAGRKVPDDVAVVGFDDTSGSDAYTPPLTTIGARFTEVGQFAVERISDMLQGRPAEHTVLRPELIVRESA